MVLAPLVQIDLCGSKDACMSALMPFSVCVCFLYGVCPRWRLLLSLSRLVSRMRSCCRKPGLGQMSLWGLTAATASRSVRPSTIIRKANTNVADRLTPIRQWTSTLPGTETSAIDTSAPHMRRNARCHGDRLASCCQCQALRYLAVG